MHTAVLDAALVVASLGLFAAAYGLAMLATRPARVQPAPSTPDLGEEPPAVVSLVANRWRLTEDASESTLLDLAARGYLELRQPGNEPMQTTIHLRQPDQEETLNPYEQRVLDRIRTLAVDGVIPVSALTFRNASRAKQWNKRLHHEVVTDARARGLSQRRLHPVVVSVLSVVAAVTAAGVSVAAFRLALRDDEFDAIDALVVGVLIWILLSAFAGRPLGERATPAGREVAARWLGVRAWLRAHEEFADLPPAAVMVWDRYLSYGAALGVTHTASAVLDLGMGDRRWVWSSHGGNWRRVRVRYPRLWRRYGKSVPRLLGRSAVGLLVGTAMVRLHGGPAQLETAPGLESAGAGLHVASNVLLIGGLVLIGYGGYVLIRTLLDLVTVRTITGEVLWIQVWRTRSGNNERAPVPWLDYLAVDDGTSDRTTAWGLPRGPLGTCQDRDTVTIRVRPWSRRVVSLTVVEHGSTRQLVDTPVEAPDKPVSTRLGALFRPPAAAAATRGEPDRSVGHLLTAEEVGRAVELAVQGPRRMPVPGPFASAMFTTVDEDHPVLMIGLVSGGVGRFMLRQAAKGTALTGVGDEAYLHSHGGAVRIGDTTIMLTLPSDPERYRPALPALLRLAADRKSAQRDSA
jgi:hypothetical protein